MAERDYTHFIHSGYAHETTRSWQAEASLSVSQLIYPIFVTEKANSKDPINAMPEQYQLSVDLVEAFLAPLVEKGLKSVLLFGVITNSPKDGTGSISSSPESPVCKATRILREKFPKLLVIADVCLCGYTDHGHCGILRKDGSIDNPRSLEQLAKMALAFANAGVHVIAPSDMMDGRVAAIKKILWENGYGSTVSVMSYSAKFASVFYGPFREAAHSAPQFGDRKSYQLPSPSRSLALRATIRDLEEGADFVMVKPAVAYMDIIREVKNISKVPVCCYHVSGEYAMLWHAAAAGAMDLKASVLETLNSLRRAGADIIITYYTPRLLDWLKEK
jgi:porphobilinogen synthase